MHCFSFQGHEDLSNESYVARHDRCEVDEKKKFLSYMKRNAGAGSGAQAGPGGRGRGRARTDSRAESSGPNTPGMFLNASLELCC